MLPDSPCRFRRGKVHVDMIFLCATEIKEKAVEHNTTIFMLFINLRKVGMP